MYWNEGNLSYTSMILYIKTLKNDASSEITHFQRDLFLNSIPEDEGQLFCFYIIDHSFCDELLPYLQ